MTAVLRDAYGLPVSTSSRAAVDAYDDGVRALLGFGADTAESFRRASWRSGGMVARSS